jgi:heme A synthase
MKYLPIFLLLLISPAIMAKSLTDPHVLSVLVPFVVALILFIIGLAQYFRKKPFKTWFISCFIVMLLQQALLYF